MFWTLRGTLTLILIGCATASLAHSPEQAPHQLYGMGDFGLESGETIKDFSISYVTHGKLNANKSNAILMVTAISGNADGPPLSRLPAERVLELAGVPIVMVHQGLVRGQPTPALAAALRAHAPAVVVFGHSHVALVERRDGVLFVNPGGGGRRRFSLPRSVALLELGQGQAEAHLRKLDA